MPRSKKPKPSFDVARTDLGESSAGWVYRSVATEAEAAPEEATPAVLPPPIWEWSYPAAKAPSNVSRSAETTPSFEWLETGVGVLLLPLTCAIAMIAPVLWMFTPKARQ